MVEHFSHTAKKLADKAVGEVAESALERRFERALGNAIDTTMERVASLRLVDVNEVFRLQHTIKQQEVQILEMHKTIQSLMQVEDRNIVQLLAKQQELQLQT